MPANTTPTTESEACVLEARRGYLAVAATVAFGCWLASAQPLSSSRSLSVWASVTVVYLFSAMPLGWQLAAYLRRRLNRPAAIACGSAGVLVAMYAIFGPGPFPLPDWPVPGSWLARTAVSVLVVTGCLLVCRAVLSPVVRDRPIQPTNRPAIAIGIILATMIPALFLNSRCEYNGHRLEDLLGQYRLGHAREIAEQLSAVSPHHQVNGVAAAQIVDELNAAVAEIESLVATPLPTGSAEDDRLERARQWAILGQIDQVERVVAPLVGANDRNPQACNLLGLAYEADEQWGQSRYWYYEAFRLLTSDDDQKNAKESVGGEQDAGQQADAALLQAVKGIAYAERKLGRYRDAELAYLRALELDSSADMHFLMAQFYEDGQQAFKAQQFAMRAMQLDPLRYEAAGRALIDELETNHFGCMSVFLRRRAGGITE